MKKRILFVCTENSARSQMAEALMTQLAGDRFEAFSAGTRPSSIDPRTIEAIEHAGLDSTELRAKAITEFKDQVFDYTVSLCEKATFECKPLGLGERFMAWNIEDPKTRSGPNPFAVTLKEINERIRMFLLVEDKK